MTRIRTRSGCLPLEFADVDLVRFDDVLNDAQLVFDVVHSGTYLMEFLLDRWHVLDVLQDCFQLVVEDFAQHLFSFVIARGLHINIVGNYPCFAKHSIDRLCGSPCASPHSYVVLDLRK